MSKTTLPTTTPVLIAGGGPVGLTLAALLASFGIRSVVIENDPSYCTGSRAICMSRRSQEILGWVGADKPLVDKGLVVGGWAQLLPRHRGAALPNAQRPHAALCAHGEHSAVFCGAIRA